MNFEESNRLKELPPYLFAEIDMTIQEKRKKGIDVISLGIGDPDLPTPSEVIETLCREARNPANHQYPSSYGLKKFREAVSDFYKKRFNVELDPDEEIIPLWGSKEGIANIAFTYINEGDYAMVPDPAYLVYKIGTMFAGGKPYTLPLKEENNFLIDLDSIDPEISKRTKIIYVNYPNNPTTASCDINFFSRLVEFAKKYNILVCHDNAYSDIYEDEDSKPLSFLNAEGSREVGIEFNSLSKTFNMTGWRIGYAVGNRDVIRSLGKYKTNVDSGVFNAIQYAAIEALRNYDKYNHRINSVYRKRRKIVTDALSEIGLQCYKSKTTIYVWSKVLPGFTSKSFAKMLLDKANVVVTPGSAFGQYGEGYIRISLTIPD
ncbi:MAG: LL-diaminopimelate aminotransferase, partial [Actinobacteria bacterium]|nr:LL-diaminopimelate aminotransferase [Actinomycetota bacterium]